MIMVGVSSSEVPLDAKNSPRSVRIDVAGGFLVLSGSFKTVQMTDQQREDFKTLFREARTVRGLHQYEVSAQTGVNQNTIGLLERSGPFTGLRAIDLLRLVSYYGLDIFKVSDLLGVSVGNIPTGSPPPTQLQAIMALPDAQKSYVLGVIDVLLRGVRRG
jgi:transcriptional regulator with XRE-family HTH domain